MESLIHKWFNRKTIQDQQKIASAQMETARIMQKNTSDRLYDTLKDLINDNDLARIQGNKSK